MAKETEVCFSDLCPIVVQFDGPDSRGSNRFSLGNIGGGEYCKNDTGEDASVKGKNAEDEIDELVLSTSTRTGKGRAGCDPSVDIQSEGVGKGDGYGDSGPYTSGQARGMLEKRKCKALLWEPPFYRL